MLSPILAFLLQVGPNPGAEPVPPIPPELAEQRRRTRAREHQQKIAAAASRLGPCLARADADPEAARREASDRLAAKEDLGRADVLHCLGYALGLQQRWDQSSDMFRAARDATPEADILNQALRGALAGGALLSKGDMAGALALLDPAHEAALVAGNDPLAGQIALDRSLALVALGRAEEAAGALVEARTKMPDSTQAWLLSATLSRRMGDLDTARGQIERAALLGPTDPDIGLEAGVIAVLAGRDEAARKSWRSVLTTAPGTEQARTAQAYLDQLDAL